MVDLPCDHSFAHKYANISFGVIREQHSVNMEIAVAKVTIGLVWKLFAPRAASQLEKGDVTTERLRQMLLSEFNKIHESLNALRRKELVAAVAFLETGE